MRFALDVIDRDDRDQPVLAWSIADELCHQRQCGCPDYGYCYGRHRGPTRAELVSVRRALHALADKGIVQIYRCRQVYDRGPRTLGAKRCQEGQTGAQGNAYEVVRCWLCNRLMRDIRVPHAGLIGREQNGRFECVECSSGTVDALALVRSGAAAEIGGT